MAKVKTKAEMFTEILAVEGLTDEMREFLEDQITKLAAASEKAAAKRAEKEAAAGPDELGEAVKSLLTDEYQTADEIFAQIQGGDDVSIAKVRARLTKLVKLGMAEKDDILFEDEEGSGKGKTKKGYKKI